MGVCLKMNIIRRISRKSYYADRPKQHSTLSFRRFLPEFRGSGWMLPVSTRATCDKWGTAVTVVALLAYTFLPHEAPQPRKYCPQYRWNASHSFIHSLFHWCPNDTQAMGFVHWVSLSFS